MIIKQVKEYSNRQRIDINKSDGIDAGAEVVILSKMEYENLINENEKLTADSLKLQAMETQEQNLKNIIENITTPIYENHKKELTAKDDKIKQLEHQLKSLQAKTNQYNLELMGLNFIDFVRGKHKRAILEFDKTISLFVNADKLDNVGLIDD